MLIYVLADLMLRFIAEQKAYKWELYDIIIPSVRTLKTKTK